MDSNLKQVYVQAAGTAALSGARQIFNPFATDGGAAGNYVQNGEVFITGVGGHVLSYTAYNATSNPGGISGTNPHDTFRIAWRQDDAIFQSAEIKVADVSSYVTKPYRPTVEQCTTIGYNGVAADGGSTDTFTTTAASEQENHVTIYREDDDQFMGIDRPKTGVYIQGTNQLYVNAVDAIDASVTVAAKTKEAEIVLGIGDALYKEFVKTNIGFIPNDIPIRIERLIGGTFTDVVVDAGTITDGNATVYFGSDIVTFAVGCDALAVGSIITIGNVLYVVKEVINLTTIRIDVAFQGTSGVYANSATSGVDKISKISALADGTYFGLKITGRPLIYTAPGLWRYAKTMFKVQTNTPAYSTATAVTGTIRNYGVCATGLDTKGFTTTTSAYVVAGTLIPNAMADLGLGTYAEVRDLEWFSKGFYGREKGYLLSVDREATNRKLVADLNGSTAKYSIVNIEFKKKFDNAMTYTINDSGNVIIAVPITVSDNGSSTYTLADTQGASSALLATQASYGWAIVLDNLMGKTTNAAGSITYDLLNY